MPQGVFDIVDYLLEPKLTNLIIFSNFIFFVFVHFSANATQEVILSMVVSGENLARGNYWCLLTAGFIHANFSHLFFNELADKSDRMRYGR